MPTPPPSLQLEQAAELSRHVGCLDGGATFAFEGAVSPVCRRSCETGRASAKVRVTGPAVSAETDATRSPERASVWLRAEARISRLGHARITSKIRGFGYFVVIVSSNTHTNSIGVNP